MTAEKSDTYYTRPKGVMGGPCLHCQGSQPEHVGITCAQVRENRRKGIKRMLEKAMPVPLPAITPAEVDRLIEWHTMASQVSEQTDDFGGARWHREKLAEWRAYRGVALHSIAPEAIPSGPGPMQAQHPMPCWCPYCGEPHSPAVRETAKPVATDAQDSTPEDPRDEFLDGGYRTT